MCDRAAEHYVYVKFSKISFCFCTVKLPYIVINLLALLPYTHIYITCLFVRMYSENILI
jgi:hypothetical protein